MGVYSTATIGLFIYLAATDQLVMEDGERLGESLTGNANAFAGVFMVAAMFSVYFMFFSKRRITKIAFFVMLCLQLYSLALSGGRKSFIIPILLLCAMKLISTDKKGRKHLIRNALIVAVVLYAVFSAIFYIEDLYNSIGYRMEGMMSVVTGEGKIDASSNIRGNMIKDALELWKEKPLFGYGVTNFQKLSGYGTYSHNNYAELLCGLGLFGLAFYYCFYLICFYKLLSNKHQGKYRWYWIFTLICLLVFDFGAISYNMFMVQFLLLISLMDIPDITKTKEDGKAI